MVRHLQSSTSTTQLQGLDLILDRMLGLIESLASDPLIVKYRPAAQRSYANHPSRRGTTTEAHFINTNEEVYRNIIVLIDKILLAVYKKFQ